MQAFSSPFKASILLIALLSVHSPMANGEGVSPAAPRTEAHDKGSDEASEDCNFKTHECELCSMDADGKVICSSVGIACEPTKWSCLKQVDGSTQ